LVLSGLEEVDRSLRDKDFRYPLNELWTVNLRLGGASLDQESTQGGDEIWMKVFIEATALESEYHDRSNIWSREMGWSLSLETIDGTIISQEGVVVLPTGDN
jgi:hypothetical protein